MKRALLVGIDQYQTFRPLAGCANDVAALAPLLGRNQDNTPNFECQALVSPPDQVTREGLIRQIESLLAPGADLALLYFAGHGYSRQNDVVLVTADGTEGDPGVAFSEILARIATTQVREIIVILDCCFAGGAGGVPPIAGDNVVLRSGVSILAASRADQPAAESPRARGKFSEFLCGALDGGASDVLGTVNLAGLYAYLSESFGAWEQRPTFKANMDRLSEVRTCSPSVPINELRRLPEFFQTEDAELRLDPSFEPDAEPRSAQNEQVFAILQRCRAAKLVDPVGAEHMYFAAMENKSCRLTPLGRHYWQLASQGRL